MDWVQNLKKATGRRQLLNRFFFSFKRNIITYEKRERDGQTGFPPPTWQCCQPLLRDDDYYGPLRANFGKALASGFWGPRLALARWTTPQLFSWLLLLVLYTPRYLSSPSFFFSIYFSAVKQNNRVILLDYNFLLFTRKGNFFGGRIISLSKRGVLRVGHFYSTLPAVSS